MSDVAIGAFLFALMIMFAMSVPVREEIWGELNRHAPRSQAEIDGLAYTPNHKIGYVRARGVQDVDMWWRVHVGGENINNIKPSKQYSDSPMTILRRAEDCFRLIKMSDEDVAPLRYRAMFRLPDIGSELEAAWKKQLVDEFDLLIGGSAYPKQTPYSWQLGYEPMGDYALATGRKLKVVTLGHNECEYYDAEDETLVGSTYFDRQSKPSQVFVWRSDIQALIDAEKKSNPLKREKNE